MLILFTTRKPLPFTLCDCRHRVHVVSYYELTGTIYSIHVIHVLHCILHNIQQATVTGSKAGIAKRVQRKGSTEKAPEKHADTSKSWPLRGTSAPSG